MKRVLCLTTLFLLLIPASIQAQVLRGDFVQVDLIGSTTPVASAGPSTGNTGATVSRMHNFKEGVFLLNVTAGPNAAAQRISVWVQHSVDGGSTWTDLLRFADVDTTSATKRIAYWTSALAPGPWVTSLVADVERGVENQSIAAGTVQMGPIGSLMRVAYNYNSLTASWTFSVTGFFKH